jgi:hypothetical protein
MVRLSLLAAVSVAVILASSAQAAAPNYILVSGPRLAHPVLLADWSENLALLSALVDAPRAQRGVLRRLSRRPRFQLAEFWGWEGMPAPTRPSEASQYGRFYPSHQRQPAVITVMVDGVKAPRLAPAAALSIFARHAIPIRL